MKAKQAVHKRWSNACTQVKAKQAVHKRWSNVSTQVKAKQAVHKRWSNVNIKQHILSLKVNHWLFIKKYYVDTNIKYWCDWTDGPLVSAMRFRCTLALIRASYHQRWLLFCNQRYWIFTNVSSRCRNWPYFTTPCLALTAHVCICVDFE